MFFHSFPTRGHHVITRAHGRDSLDSTEPHRANILLFQYVFFIYSGVTASYTNKHLKLHSGQLEYQR